MFFVDLIKDENRVAINLQHCNTIEVTKHTDLSPVIKISHSGTFTILKYDTRELAIEDFESLMKAIKCQKDYWESSARTFEMPY